MKGNANPQQGNLEKGSCTGRSERGPASQEGRMLPARALEDIWRSLGGPRKQPGQSCRGLTQREHPGHIQVTPRSCALACALGWGCCVRALWLQARGPGTWDGRLRDSRPHPQEAAV